MATTINAGRVAMVPKGSWDSTTAYSRLDVVMHNGSSWICITDSTGNEPVSGSTYWQLAAEGVDANNYYTKAQCDGIFAAIGGKLTHDFSASNVHISNWNLASRGTSFVFTRSDNVEISFPTPASGGSTVAYTSDLTTKLAAKQDRLVSGTNIKTINGESLLGAGNIAIEARNVLVVPVRYTGSRYVPSVSYDVAVAYINAGGTVAYVVGGVVYIATTIYTNEIVGVAIDRAGTAKKVSHYINVSGDIFTLNNQRLNSSISITETLPDSVASATGAPVSDRTVIIALQSYVKKRTYVDNSADASVELSVATYNDLGTLSAWKTITLPASYDRADEFIFRFVCNDASLTPTLPQGVVMADNFEWSEMAVGVVFQVSICDGIAAYLCLTPNP